MFSKIHEECGVFGIYTGGGTDVAGLTYSALFALQHRGQESCGIAVNDDGVISGYKDLGLVGEVFPPERLQKLGGGQLAVGHVRYATTGRKSRENAQPLIINHIKGSMALAHNGNLTNAAELREALELNGAIFHTTSDTEVIAYTITNERLRASSIEEAVSAAMDRIKGAYSLVIMSPQKLIAVRDPHGFRPLCIGRLGDGWVFASESCALDGIGAQFVRDVRPGEIVIADKGGLRSITTHCGQCPRSLCVFEYIYFARPDSDIDGRNVHAYRKESGRLLWKEAPAEADIVVGVPDSSLSAAMGYAEASGLPYEMGLIKNKYIGRTFIQPSQSMREKGVRMKLSSVSGIVSGQRVVLIDDSIVRGTTSRRIVRLLREAGATEVHVRIASPPFKNPCFYGVDTSTYEELLCARMSVPEACEYIGADSLAYLSPDALLKAGNRCELCMACFTGNYPTSLYGTIEEANKKEKC